MKKKKRTAYTFVSFLFLSVSLLCSSTIYAQNSTVNLNYKDASFVEVINEFRKQTGVKFMYNLEKVKNKRFRQIRYYYPLASRQIQMLWQSSLA